MQSLQVVNMRHETPTFAHGRPEYALDKAHCQRWSRAAEVGTKSVPHLFGSNLIHDDVGIRGVHVGEN